MFDISSVIERANEFLQGQDITSLTELGDVTQLLEGAGIDPQDLAGLPFDQAAELLTQAGIGPEVLSDPQAIELITSVLGDGAQP
ncbi:MAG: hypothetical protein ACR2PO_15630 [Methyloligellaceae bacterium]